MVQLERLGDFRLHILPGAENAYGLQCVRAWLPKTPPKPGKRQRVPTAVHDAAASEAATRRQAMKDAASHFSLEEPLLLMCACERWERVLALDLREAWRDLGELEEIGQGLFRLIAEQDACPTSSKTKDPVPKPPLLGEGTFNPEAVWHVAGLRRCLRLFTLPGSQQELLSAIGKRSLSFPNGWSLEHEGPYPVRYESLAPYAQTCGFLATQLGRAIAGPIQACDVADPVAATPLVTVQVIGTEDLYLLAEDVLSFDSFNPTEFGRAWRLRPFPDYSAALEPLAALAMLGLGLRVHRRFWSNAPFAFLDATCGTGTLAAAAKYCVKEWKIFAGDVNATLVQRARINLEAAFPGQAYELADNMGNPPPDPGGSFVEISGTFTGVPIKIIK